MKKLLFLCSIAILITACNSNPLFSIKEARLVRFINANDELQAGEICANYYAGGRSIKVSRVSTLCSEFTRRLADAAMKRKLVKDATITEKHFRDKKVWEIWLKFAKKKEKK